MSTDKEKLNELVGKVDKILKALSEISEEMRSVSASMKSLAGGQITQPTATQAPTPPEAVQNRVVQNRGRLMKFACHSQRNLRLD